MCVRVCVGGQEKVSAAGRGNICMERRRGAADISLRRQRASAAAHVGNEARAPVVKTHTERQDEMEGGEEGSGWRDEERVPVGARMKS